MHPTGGLNKPKRFLDGNCLPLFTLQRCHPVTLLVEAPVHIVDILLDRGEWSRQILAITSELTKRSARDATDGR